MFVVGKDDAELVKYGRVHAGCRLVEFSFYANAHPLRTFQSGKSKFVPILIAEVPSPISPRYPVYLGIGTEVPFLAPLSPRYPRVPSLYEP